MERRIGDKLIVVDKHHDVPFVILVDLKYDKTFLLEDEEVQALREVLAGLEEPKGREFYEGAQVRIVGKRSDHNFKIGTVGRIIDSKPYEGCCINKTRVMGWRVQDKDGSKWFVHESDMELLDDDAGGMSE